MCQALGTRAQIRHSPYLQWLQSCVSIQSYHVVEGRMMGFWMNYCGNQGTSIMYLRSGTRGWHLSEGNIWVGGFLAVWKWRKRIRTWILLLKYLITSVPTKYPIQRYDSFFGGYTFFFGQLLLSYFSIFCLETSPDRGGFVESDFTLGFWNLLHWWSIELLMAGSDRTSWLAKLSQNSRDACKMPLILSWKI